MRKNIAIIVLCVVIGILLRNCNILNSDNKRLSTNVGLMEGNLDKERNDKGQVVAEKQSLMMTVKELKESGLLKDNKIKRLKNVIAKSVFNIVTTDTVKTALVDSILDTLVIGRKFKWNDDFLYMNGFISGDSLVIGYKDYNSFDVTYLWKRKRLFAPKKAYVKIVPMNPKTDVTGLQNIIVRPEKKKFWQTKGFAFGVGALGGYILRGK